MKKCPHCGRDYNDDSLSFCLDDGSELLFGPKSEPGAAATGFLGDEPQTAILPEIRVPPSGGSRSEPPASERSHFVSENPTRPLIHTTAAEAEPRESLGGATEKQSFSANRAAEPHRALIGSKPLAALVVGAVVLAGGFFAYRYFAASGSGAINSIAVLPFLNTGGNSDADYLSDGLAESLIYRLSSLPNLKVSPTSAVFRYKGKETNPEAIAKELGVDSVVTGRIAQRGDNLSISVNLVDTRDGKSLWGEQYERKISELLNTQREMASEIASKLQINLSGNRQQRLAKDYTESNDAYQLYLKGRHAWNLRTGEGIKQSVEYYNQAIAADAGFARAYSGLAESYIIFANYDLGSAKDSMPLAKAAALRAIELDDSLAEAHTAYAAYLKGYEFDPVGAEREFRKAIKLDPNYATAHQWLGELLSAQKRFDEGIAETRLALEADPLSPVISFNMGWQYFVARRYDEAMAEMDATSVKFPDFNVVHVGRCHILFAQGDLAKAVPECQKMRELLPDAWNIGYLALVLGRSGNTAEAKALLDELKDESRRRSITPMAFAYAYMGLNDREKALQMFENAVSERDYFVTTDLSVCPEFDEFRSDPRFKALLKKSNLPD